MFTICRTAEGWEKTVDCVLINNLMVSRLINLFRSLNSCLTNLQWQNTHKNDTNEDIVLVSMTAALHRQKTNGICETISISIQTEENRPTYVMNNLKAKPTQSQRYPNAKMPSMVRLQNRDRAYLL